MDHNEDKFLCRFEFLEVLVQIARGKYIETGAESNLSQALSTLFNRHILPMHPQLPNLNEWRISELWTIEMNNLLEVNLPSIRELYDFLS